MITPRFSLSQDDTYVVITIRAPYCSLRELDVDIEDQTFLFLCKPYYLRLQLPGCIVENENSSSSFDSDTGEFTFKYEKAIPGEDFKDLELITKFLVTKVDAAYNSGPKITMLSSDSNVTEISQPEGSLDHGFGFALNSHKSFATVSSEFSEVFEIDPLEVNINERRKMRIQYEQGKFDMEHYLADFINDEEISEIISQKTPWSDLTPNSVTFSEKELDFLKDLQNIKFTLTDQQVKYAYNGLIDILYAYCYDRRTTFYEENAESGWTIVKLAATFCWLDVFENPKDTLVSAFRRSVIYPLYRHYELSKQILEDLKMLLRLGEKYIIKCLIEMYYIFLGGDCCRYILNNLFIKDYITYIMMWDKDSWQAFLDDVKLIDLRKQDLGLNLEQIENGYGLDYKFSTLRITDSDSDDSTECGSLSSEGGPYSDSESDNSS